MSEVYTIIIEEVISEEFSVEAQSEEAAVKKAIRNYKNGLFVLSPGNVEHKQLMIIKDGELGEPIEF